MSLSLSMCLSLSLSLSLSLYIYISILRFLAQGKGLSTRISSLESLAGFRAFQCSGRSDLLKIAQRAPRAAQSRSESLRACPEPLRAAQSVRSELFEEPLWVAQSRSESPRAVAQGRPEPLRIAQSAPRAAQSRPELFEETLWVAGSPRARPELLRLKSRSESHGVCPEPLRVAQSCSKNRSGSSVSHALCISDAQFYFTWFPLLRACICTGSH